MSDRDRATYLLLEYVIEYQMPLGALISPDVDQFMNRPHHRLEKAPLVECMSDLVTNGDVFLSVSDVMLPDPSMEVIASCIDGSGPYTDSCYGLTAKGAARWEDWSRVDWTRYVSSEASESDLTMEVEGESRPVWQGKLVSLSRERAEQYLKGLPFMRQRVLDSTVRWGCLSPCRLSYWKSLPQGHQVTFEYVEVEGFPQGPLPDGVERKRLLDLFSPSGWFTRPSFVE